MNAPATASSSGSAFLAAGILMIADIKPRYAAVIEVIAHEGAEIRKLDDFSTVVTSPVATTFYCAYYGTDVSTNRWDPCDQAVAAAYMPLRYGLLDSRVLEDGGTFLLQKHAAHERVWRNVVGDDHEVRLVTIDRHDPIGVAQAVARLLREAGVPAGSVHQCAGAVQDHLGSLN